MSNYIFPGYLDETNFIGQQSYIAMVADQPQIKGKSVKVVANVADLEHHTNGKVLLYFEKDSISTGLKYGQEILLRTQIH